MEYLIQLAINLRSIKWLNNSQASLLISLPLLRLNLWLEDSKQGDSTNSSQESTI